MSTDFKVKTLGKAMTILECFSVKTPELGITEISKKLGLQKSNVYDILYTFGQMGYVEQNPLNGKYSLGVKMLEFSFIVNEHMGYARIVYDIVENLANDVQQIVFFAIPMGTEVFYIYSAHPQSRLSQFPYRNIAGEKCPMYCSALGKSMLAFSPPSLMKQMERVKREQFTPNTIMTQEALEKEIELVRKRGYSTDHAEHEYNLGAVSVPVLDRSNRLVGAISIYGVCASIMERTEYYVQKLHAIALEIRERL